MCAPSAFRRWMARYSGRSATPVASASVAPLTGWRWRRSTWIRSRRRWARDTLPSYKGLLSVYGSSDRRIMRVAVIVNPAARKGGARARWPAIQAELAKRLGPVEPLFTEAPGHATHLARNALARGVRRFVAVGGDGTVNETLNGLLDPAGRLIEPDAVLCPVPAGTANEICRALGFLANAGRAFDAAASPRTQAIAPMR